MSNPSQPTEAVTYDDQRIACDFLEDHGFAPAVVNALRETIDFKERCLTELGFSVNGRIIKLRGYHIANLDEKPGQPELNPRLIFDPAVSEESPVIRGTSITAKMIFEYIQNGFMTIDIIRAHPSLTDGDIRECLAYVNDPDNQ